MVKCDLPTTVFSFYFDSPKFNFFGRPRSFLELLHRLKMTCFLANAHDIKNKLFSAIIFNYKFKKKLLPYNSAYERQ